MWSTASSAVDAFFQLHWISETWHGLCSSKIPSQRISDNYRNFAIKSKSKLCNFICSNELFQEGHVLHATQSMSSLTHYCLIEIYKYLLIVSKFHWEPNTDFRAGSSTALKQCLFNIELFLFQTVKVWLQEEFKNSIYKFWFPGYHHHHQIYFGTLNK